MTRQPEEDETRDERRNRLVDEPERGSYGVGEKLPPNERDGGRVSRFATAIPWVGRDDASRR
jgi:hypothetical protein